mgnify:CR=1 FL=1
MRMMQSRNSWPSDTEFFRDRTERTKNNEGYQDTENTGIDYDKNQQIFSLESLGEKIQILYPQYEITPKLNDWHHLLILHYIESVNAAVQFCTAALISWAPELRG